MLEYFMVGISYGSGFLVGMIVVICCLIAFYSVMDVLTWVCYKVSIALLFIPMAVIKRAKRNHYRKVGC